MESNSNKPENYKKVKELGKGACGKAYLVQGESTKQYAVIKQVDINAIKSREEREKVYQVGENHKFTSAVAMSTTPPLVYH